MRKSSVSVPATIALVVGAVAPALGQLVDRTLAQGQGPVTGDGAGDVQVNLAIGAGLADSCAACHGRPRGAAGFGGDVAPPVPTAGMRRTCSASASRRCSPTR